MGGVAGQQPRVPLHAEEPAEAVGFDALDDAGDAVVGPPVLSTTPSVLDAGVWQAARFGLSDGLIHPETCKPEPASAVVGALLEVARPGLEAHGDDEQVAELVARLLTDGTGADRQRAAFRAGGPARIVEQAAQCMAPGAKAEPLR